MVNGNHNVELPCNDSNWCSWNRAPRTPQRVLLLLCWWPGAPPARVLLSVRCSCWCCLPVLVLDTQSRQLVELKPSLCLCCRGVLLLAHFLFSFLRLTASSPCRPQVVKTRLMPVIRRDHALVSGCGACSFCFQITFWCVSSCVWLLRLAFLQLSIDASVASHVRQNFR